MSQTLYASPELSVELRPDGVVYVVVEGVTEPDQVAHVAEVMFEIYRQYAPVLNLLEVRNLQADNLAARWKMSQVLKQQRPFIRRSAVIGVPSRLRFMAQVIVKVSGRNNIRFFGDADAATDWLLS